MEQGWCTDPPPQWETRGCVDLLLSHVNPSTNKNTYSIQMHTYIHTCMEPKKGALLSLQLMGLQEPMCDKSSIINRNYV